MKNHQQRENQNRLISGYRRGKARKWPEHHRPEMLSKASSSHRLISRQSIEIQSAASIVERIEKEKHQHTKIAKKAWHGIGAEKKSLSSKSASAKITWRKPAITSGVSVIITFERKLAALQPRRRQPKSIEEKIRKINESSSRISGGWQLIGTSISIGI